MRLRQLHVEIILIFIFTIIAFIKEWYFQLIMCRTIRHLGELNKQSFQILTPELRKRADWIVGLKRQPRQCICNLICLALPIFNFETVTLQAQHPPPQAATGILQIHQPLQIAVICLNCNRHALYEVIEMLQRDNDCQHLKLPSIPLLFILGSAAAVI